jgi:hypothetical protein
MEIHLFRRAATVTEPTAEDLVEQPILEEPAVDLEAGPG